MLRAFSSHAIKDLHLLVRFLVLKEIPYNVSQTKRHSWALERVKGKKHSDCGFWNLPIYLGDDSFFIWESHGLLCRTQKPRTLSASKQLLHHIFGPDWYFACFIYNAVVGYPAGYWKMAFWNVSHIFRNHFQVITNQHLSMDHVIDGFEQVLQNCKANEIPICFHKEVHCFFSLSGVGFLSSLSLFSLLSRLVFPTMCARLLHCLWQLMKCQFLYQLWNLLRFCLILSLFSGIGKFTGPSKCTTQIFHGRMQM